MKEAFAIYMSVKKLSLYLTDAKILLRSDHKPLEKFLQKNTLNSKVNNWAMELEAFNIQFDYIKGSSNVLADTLSHLIVIDPDTPLTPEGQGYEFGYAIFEEYPEVKTNTFFPNCNTRESAFFIMFGRDPINKLNMLLHSARRCFHDNNGLPNLEALQNIYQVVAQQLLNSRECYVKKHHNQQ